MSMLAERRRKTKWVINPMKKPIWTTDSEGIKLGKQLMEKMGWSAGKGLGANEQGIQEPLKVSYKNDTKGMGFKGNDEDWLEHQDEFNSLLSQLSSSDASKPAEVDKNEIKSLEEKSKHSRARVHYQKFTRGKDLSRYSETDLACILGITHNKKPKDSLEEKNPVEEKKDGNYETSFGVTTVNSGSILDYFKKKWTIGKSKENNSFSKTPDEVAEEGTLDNTEECGLNPEHKKSKKRKISELNGESIEVPEEKTIKTFEEVENSEVGEEVEKIKKSKKRKLNEIDSENFDAEKETFKELEENENSEVGEEIKKNKKSKKHKFNELGSENIEVPEEKPVKTLEEVQNSEVGEEVKKTKKSKKRKPNEIDSENLGAEEETIKILEENENSEVGEDIKKNKKSKKNNELNSENIEVPENETVEVLEEVENSCSLEVEKESKKHKKSKKKKKEDIEPGSDSKAQKKEKYYPSNSNQIEDTNQDMQVTAGVVNVSSDNNLNLDDNKYESLQSSKEYSEDGDENFTRKRKKDKKKHKIKELDTPEENLESVQGDSDHKIKKKKKKDKEKKEKDEVTQSEVKEVIGENYSDIGKHDSSLIENGEAESASNGDEKNQRLDLIECTENDLESERSRKEKRRKEKHKLDQSKLENEKEVNIQCEIVAEESKSKKKKKKEKLSDQSILENEEGQETKDKSIHEDKGSIVKEKKKKGKHKTDQSNSENEKEQETETISTCEKTEESKKKEKKKKDKHRSDQSTLENQEELVTESVPEDIEPKAEEKTSKKSKLSKAKKSKHKTDSEGMDNSNMNSKSVEEANDDSIHKQSERVRKGETDTEVKDCTKLAKGNKPKQDEGKTEDCDRIHSHKIELFKKKKNDASYLGNWPKNSPNNRVLGLIFGAEFEKFKGSNLENLVGYGMQKKTQGKDDG